MSRNSVIESLAEEYVATRPNGQLKNKNFAIVFLASSGAGKSTLRSLIVDRLMATYVCNDEVRDLISQNGENQSLLKPVVNRVLELINQRFANHLVVFDSNMSSYYMKPDSYVNMLKGMKYEIFIVAIDVSLQVLKQRVTERNRDDRDSLLMELPAQYHAQLLAMNDLRPNIVIGESYDPDMLVDAIAARLRS